MYLVSEQEHTVRVGDQLIRFEPFDAANMQFEDNRFDGIFFLGSLHHIEEDLRINVVQECMRTSTPHAPICFFEPNENLMKIGAVVL